MPAFLHPPADANAIAEMVRAKRPENEQLDYKHEWGPWRLIKNGQAATAPTDADKLEVAKDVAAFANAVGGDIVVGVSESKKVATGFVAITQPPDAESTLRKWLDEVLVPREVAALIRVSAVSVQVETTDPAKHTVVVSVPPWPHGTVGVRIKVSDGTSRGPSNADKIAFMFPFRFGDDTRFMDLEQEMRWTSAQERSSFLQLKALIGRENRTRVQFASPVLVMTENGPQPSWGGSDSRHGNVGAADLDMATMTLTATMDENRAPVRTVIGHHKDPEFAASSAGRRVSMPIALVRAAWPDADDSKVLHVLLSAHLVWNGRTWLLTPS